jgi:hypothetical protein
VIEHSDRLFNNLRSDAVSGQYNYLHNLLPSLKIIIYRIDSQN